MLKQDVTRFYEAFNQKAPSLLDDVMSDAWVDIPTGPNQLPGREGAKHLVAELTTAFPDLTIRIDDILQDGSKVTVRSELAGTHRGAFLGFPPSGRRLTIQAIDVHEFREGKIVRTWHSEDWMTGLHQLGILRR